MHRLVGVFIWLLFILWLLAQLPTFLRLAQQGQMPIDFLAYHRAAESLKAGASPYLLPAQSQQIWQYFHQNEMEVLSAQANGGRGQSVLQEQAARPQQPGPYLYPPTLARLIAFLKISPLSFAVLLLLSVFGFSWLWLRSTGTHPLWLLLVMLSLDVFASLNGGNVELFLLFATLLAAWLLWHNQPLLAAPLLALIVLIKPFYALFFGAFGFIALVSHPSITKGIIKAWITSGTVAIVLIALEVSAWGASLRAETFRYLQQAWAHQWFSLPVAEQTPMSDWNRTPLQTLVTFGISASTAQLLALALWLLFVGVTLWHVRKRKVTFPLAFALALVLLYWGRPVGWTLAYLEVVVVVAIWSLLHRRPRWIMMCAVVAFMLSHWVAFIRTIQGYGMPLLTLQTADVPWETWLVLPLSWLLLLYGVSQSEKYAV